MPTSEYRITLPRPHAQQAAFIASKAKRRIIRAGRRGGKTVGAACLAVQAFLAGRRVLYAAPTSEQIGRFWTTVTRALSAPIAAKVFTKNETENSIILPGSEQRIRAKTAWNADTLRGDYCDLLILDEYQLMSEEAWEVVGAPMLLDNDGDAIFIYTPPSLHSRSVSKARDKRHAAKLYKRAEIETNGRWAAFTFASAENPHISQAALGEITKDMTALAYRQEILAQDVDSAPGAMWTPAILDQCRVQTAPALRRIVVAVDPSATRGGDECGIVAAGIDYNGLAYVLADESVQGAPMVWARAAVDLYHRLGADRLIAESNQGGEMVSTTINTVDENISVKLIHANRGKQARAEPVSAQYARVGEDGKVIPGPYKVFHVGEFDLLEEEMVSWEPNSGAASPNRLDAAVYALTELLLGGGLQLFT